ncbi:MAG TPA: hypothetical protein DCR64_15185 [Vibrio sp.]|nr:hypothetical protein [Vibrio sp.]
MKVYDTRELANLFGISKKTLERKREDGTRPKYFRIGSSIRYQKDAVDEWIKESTCRSTCEY